MALGVNVGGFYTTLKLWLEKEPVKLALAALAIAFIKVSMTGLTPVLAAAQSYGENHVNFTEYGAFSKLCGSGVTWAVAGALLLVRRKKPFEVRPPLYAYAVIAIAAAIAIVAENQLNHGVGEEWNLSWQCFIVFVVIVGSSSNYPCPVFIYVVFAPRIGIKQWFGDVESFSVH